MNSKINSFATTHRDQTVFQEVAVSIQVALERYKSQLALMESVRQERKTLGYLPDYLLADIGVNRGEAQREANRGYFDIPNARR